MKPLSVLSVAEQVAAHLREELRGSGRKGELPGVLALARELGVNHKTVKAALALLERDGILEKQGTSKARRIAPDASFPRPEAKSLRIAILIYNRFDQAADYVVEFRHRLQNAGHAPFYSGKSMTALGMDTERIIRHIESVEADAWVVIAGLRPVMEWFAEKKLPVFAMLGAMHGIGVAGTGPDKGPAYQEVVRNLAGLGHRRIVLLGCPQEKYFGRDFLAAMKTAGIPTSPYNLPVWENSREAFHRCLGSVFQITPPTALIIQEALLFFCARQFLSRSGRRVPEDVSLVCTDPDPNFDWQEPSIAHITWDSAPWVRRAVGWAANISREKDDRRQVASKATFVPGGTVGPVRKA